MSVARGQRIRIRRYQKKDWKATCDLIRRTITVYLSHDQSAAVTKKMVEMFSHHNTELFAIWNTSPSCVWVAEDRGKIVGVIRGSLRIRIRQLYVNGAYQRQGIGKKLVTAFAQAARRNNCVFVKVRSAPSAIGFYTRCGFKKTTSMRRNPKSGIRYQPMKLFLS